MTMKFRWISYHRSLRVLVNFSAVLMGMARLSTGTDPLDVLEILETHCVQCHGGSSTKGGLDLVTREGLLRGGESGESVVPGDPNASLLVELIQHELEPRMPYKAAKLSDPVIAQMVGWVKAGVPYRRPLNKASVPRPAEAGFTLTDVDRNHWSFLPVSPVQTPTIPGHTSSTENPIDQFVLAKLDSKGLTAAPGASKMVLIRRVTLDLIGLPPTPDEIDEFLNDGSPTAYERLIDRLLASPHYGERWGRHWLDLARYAETDGFEHDAVRVHSWRYRDYVITSFNDDKPYDRFVREQIAGDELWPNDTDAITATGFNLLGPDMVDSADQVQRRHNTLNDMTDTTALAFLGLTIGCARCHDHKFEPFSQRDYYRLQAHFTPAKFLRDRPIPSSEDVRTFEATTRAFNEHPKVQELTELERPFRDKLLERKLARLSAEAQIARRTPADQRTVQQANLVLETEDDVKVSLKEVIAAMTDEEKQRHVPLQEEVKKLPKPIPLPRAMAMANETSAVPKTFVLHRGEYLHPEDEVTPGTPVVFASNRKDSNTKQPIDAADAQESSAERVDPTVSTLYRTELANWIGSRHNPLTARVIVNRIWQHHFGRGLVPTPSDFGTHGQMPSHPELLDWLANQFMAQGWSIKQMHRLMLTSATYCRVSVQSDIPSITADGESAFRIASTRDLDNRLYWRMNRVRLEGEVIRDALLAISGQLNPALGGPSVFPPIPKELSVAAKGWLTNDRTSDHCRRSVYIFARRNLRFPFLEVFDAPDTNLSCPVRDGSTTAPQSLTLLNATEVTTAAKLTATRLTNAAESTDDQIRLAYRLVLGRAPKSRELSLAREFLVESPLDELCRALFNLNEFVYVE